MLIRPTTFPLFLNVPRVVNKMHNMIVPVLWFNETVLFDSGTRDKLRVFAVIQKTVCLQLLL